MVEEPVVELEDLYKLKEWDFLPVDKDDATLAKKAEKLAVQNDSATCPGW